VAEITSPASKDILFILFSIASRGGFKLNTVILSIAIFTGMITAFQNIVFTYAVNAPIIGEVSTQPQLTVYKEYREGSLKVEVASIFVNDVLVIILSPSDIVEFLKLMNVDGVPTSLKVGEALISEDLLPLTEFQNLEVDGLCLKISGVLPSSARLLKSIIVSSESMRSLDLETEFLYYGRLGGGEPVGYTESPSLINLIHGVILEVQTLLSMVTYLLYITLSLTCLVQALHVMDGGRSVLKAFSVLGVSRGSLYLSLVIFAVVVSAVSVVLGYAIGVVASTSTSAVYSLVLDVPYLKPMVSDSLLLDLALAFISSSFGVSIGYVRGCMLASSN